jgi:hypothetical protein
MPADTMELAYVVIGEIGADVADITIPGEITRQLHLPGADILLLAGLTVVSAFLRGLLTGIVAETGTAGQEPAASLVRRFTGLIARVAPGAAAPAGSPGDEPAEEEPTEDGPGGDDDGDVLTDFRQAAADAEAALTQLGVTAGALGQYAPGAQAEVAAALRSLGLRGGRVRVLAPAATRRLIGQVHTDLTAT